LCWRRITTWRKERKKIVNKKVHSLDHRLSKYPPLTRVVEDLLPAPDLLPDDADALFRLVDGEPVVTACCRDAMNFVTLPPRGPDSPDVVVRAMVTL
jgi:hypothetical protein